MARVGCETSALANSEGITRLFQKTHGGAGPGRFCGPGSTLMGLPSPRQAPTVNSPAFERAVSPRTLLGGVCAPPPGPKLDDRAQSHNASAWAVHPSRAVPK